MRQAHANTQQTIVDWFDAVYRRKGSGYLRPPEAYLVFLELLRASPQDTLLDVACGPGVLLQAACGYTRNLYGIDISAAAIEQGHARAVPAQMCVGNAERLPYADNTFDLITCLGSLERMLDVSKVLAEIKRVAKPDARCCFLVRNSNTATWKYLAALTARQRSLGHAGADTLRSWRTLFESHGLAVIEVLPDQYPLQLRKKWSSLALRQVDFKQPIRVSGSIERANEFVFLLENSLE
jgi:SAM-dependent methyltransferase